MRTHYEVYKVIHTGVFDGIHDYIYLNKGEYKSLPGAIRKAELLKQDGQDNVNYQVNYYENGCLVSEIEV